MSPLEKSNTPTESSQDAQDTQSPELHSDASRASDASASGPAQMWWENARHAATALRARVPHFFFGLRWRLAFVYAALFCIFGIILVVLISYYVQHESLRNLLIVVGILTIIMIALGTIVIFLLTGIMLRPLRRMTDTVRAIALGDLKQRVRLAGPQSNDEIGTLAMSFNEMVDQMEHALEAREASERRAKRFVSDASHELRTPITSLRGFTEVLMRGAKDDPETTQRVLKLMKSEAERMTRLVNDLLMLARLDEGEPLNTADVDLVDVAIEGVRQAKMMAMERPGDGRKVLLDLATQERLKVRADIERLKQMLLLLLDNAVKYGRAGPDGWIIVRLDKQDDYALLEVVNNGQGIAPEDLPHVFDRFYRGHHSPPVRPDGNSSSAVSVPPIAGTGLGLSIAIAIAHAHAGDVTARSEPDKETVFTVKLPSAD
jgi:two-component system, OmpR family, sensor kinase